MYYKEHIKDNNIKTALLISYNCRDIGPSLTYCGAVSKERVPNKKTTKLWTYVQTVGR